VGLFSKTKNPDRLDASLVMGGLPVGITFDPKAATVWEIRGSKRDAFPVAGARAEVGAGADVHRRFTATRLVGGAAAGAVFLPLAIVGLARKQAGHVFLTILSADGQQAIVHECPAKKEAAARKFAAEFNAVAARLAAEQGVEPLVPAEEA
jgi:hypothetical protein